MQFAQVHFSFQMAIQINVLNQIASLEQLPSNKFLEFHQPTFTGNVDDPQETQTNWGQYTRVYGSECKIVILSVFTVRDVDTSCYEFWVQINIQRVYVLKAHSVS